MTAAQAVKAIRERVRPENHAESVRVRVNGTPTFTGSRLPVQFLFNHFAHGDSIEDILENYPTAGRARVVRLLNLACNMMDAVANEDALE